MSKDVKRCLLCGTVKPINQFNTRANRYCLECVRTNQEYKKAREIEAIQKGEASNLELFRTCPGCNQSYPATDFLTVGTTAKCYRCRLEIARNRRAEKQREREAYIAQLNADDSTSQVGYSYGQTKQCTSCGQVKSISDFYVDTRQVKVKRNPKCKICVRDAARIARQIQQEKKERERIEASLSILHQERIRQKARKQYNSHLLSHFGKSIEEYDAMLKEQQGRCAICKTLVDRIDERLVVDHSHVTGVVRGLLCFNCNVGLGWFRDNMTSLSNAIEYLKSYGTWEDQDYINEMVSRSSQTLTEAS